jgi:small GTP-binding protein
MYRIDGYGIVKIGYDIANVTPGSKIHGRIFPSDRILQLIEEQKKKEKRKKMSEEQVKVVVLGEAGVGKTSLLLTYFTGAFETGYVPSIADMLEQEVQVNAEGDVAVLQLWDTASTEGHFKMLPLSFPETCVFLLCYTVSDAQSFELIVERWLPLIEEHAEDDVPIVLAGLRCDLRDDEDVQQQLKEREQQFVASDDVRKLVGRCSRIVHQLECSAKCATNLSQLFVDVGRIALRMPVVGKDDDQSRCFLM